MKKNKKNHDACAIHKSQDIKTIIRFFRNFFLYKFYFNKNANKKTNKIIGNCMTRKNHHVPDKSSMNDVNEMIFKNIV